MHSILTHEEKFAEINKSIFDAIDTDNSGTLEREEVETFVKSLLVGIHNEDDEEYESESIDDAGGEHEGPQDTATSTVTRTATLAARSAADCQGTEADPVALPWAWGEEAAPEAAP